MEIRILIADKHRVVREAICSLLRNEYGMDIVGEAEDGRTAVQLARELRPDVIIMETSMPNLNGIEATRQIASRTTLCLSAIHPANSPRIT